MRSKNSNQTIFVILILAMALLLAGCSQPQRKPDQPTVPQPQNNMMGQANPSSMMHNNPEAMQKAMSAPENRQAMINMMSSPQMRPAMADMMKDPAMRQAMTDIMADPAMKDTFAAMVKDPRLAPIARESLK